MKTTTTATETKTCQICGRGIKLVRGNIALHGYSRPGAGWQTASCPGAKHLPFEVSSDRLVAHVAGIAAQVEHDRAALAAPVVSVDVVVGRKTSFKPETCATVTEETLPAQLVEFPQMGIPGRNGIAYGETLTWSKLVGRKRQAQARDLEQTRGYLAHQSRRLAAWVAPA